MATNGKHAMLHDLNLPPRFWAVVMTTFMYLRNRVLMRANNSITPYEHFYGVKLDMVHICTFGCIVCVMLPSKELGKMDNHGAMSYLMGYQDECAFRIWIPHSGVKEVRDVTFFKGTAPALPDHGLIKEVQPIRVQVADPLKSPPGPMIAAPEPVPQAIGDISDEDGDNKSTSSHAATNYTVDMRTRVTIHVPGHYHPNALKPAIETLSSLAGDANDNATQYVGFVHQYPMHSMCSRLVHQSGAGASLTSGVFEELAQDLVPTPSAPNPWSIQDALDTPDANERHTAMDIKIENMCRLNVLKTVPCPPDTNTNTSQWVFHQKFENGILIKYKVRLVGRGFIQVSGVDYSSLVSSTLGRCVRGTCMYSPAPKLLNIVDFLACF